MDTKSPIVTFATYYDPMLAQIVRARLEDAGIPAMVDDSMMNTYPIYSNALSGIKVKVFEHDLTKAREVLAEDESLPVDKMIDPADQPVTCPYCGSNNVRNALPMQTNDSWLNRTLSNLFSALPFSKDADWHCFNCGKDFE